MAKENKLEYERDDTEHYRRVRAKFNPKFLRGCDFELEFCPLLEAIRFGETFVKNVDSHSDITLYRWENRRQGLIGAGKYDPGTLQSEDVNRSLAKDGYELYRMGKLDLSPRVVIGHIKSVYPGVSKAFSEPTACTYNWYLYSNQIGTLPYRSDYFTIEDMKASIEEVKFPSLNSSGEVVDRSFIDHMFDTHETKYARTTILNFLEFMWIVTEEFDKKRREERSKSKRKR